VSELQDILLKEWKERLMAEGYIIITFTPTLKRIKDSEGKIWTMETPLYMTL